MGHLGPRVSALLDGQLSAEETDRAWGHVHACHACRDLVEREGWVKTQLSALSWDRDAHPPADLAGQLIGLPAGGADAAVSPGWTGTGSDSSGSALRRTTGLVAISGGALGAAMLGVIALGAAPADAPSIDRRAPASQLGQLGQSGQLGTGSPTPVLGPARRSTLP